MERNEDFDYGFYLVLLFQYKSEGGWLFGRGTGQA